MNNSVPYEQMTPEQKLRACWDAFCDADPVPAEFSDDMEAAGLVELQFLTKHEARRVMDADMHWEAKYGEEPPTSIYALTDAGRLALKNQESDRG